MTAFRSQLHSFLEAARRSADAAAALRPHLAQLAGQDSASYSLLAFGKASLEMAAEAVRVLGDRLSGGVVTCVPERLNSLKNEQLGAFRTASIDLLPADHPLPTPRNILAAERTRDFVRGLAPSDHLLVLLSGGGSAHLTLPSPGLTLEDLRDATKLLQRAGMDIRALNAVRKHCEQLKGGRLAALCSAQDVRVLILSDVPGDPLDVISSGPFAPDTTTFADALAVVESANGWGRMPAIAAHLRRGTLGELEETPKPGDPALLYVATTLIASNRQLVDALAEHAAAVGVPVAEKWCEVTGDCRSVAARVCSFVRSRRRAGTPRVLIAGGEWTVDVGSATGTGGPSQELALALAVELANEEFAACVYSTDGIDGPTDAAGAMVHGGTLAASIRAGIDARRALEDHDSFGLFASAPAECAEHIRTGPTGTNVNHVAVVLF